MSVYPCEDFAEKVNSDYKHPMNGDDCLVCKALEETEYINEDLYDSMMEDYIINTGEWTHNDEIDKLFDEKCRKCMGDQMEHRR